MNWRWLFLDYIDPALGLTRTEQRAVRARSLATARRAKLSVARSNQGILFPLLVVVLAVAVCNAAAIVGVACVGGAIWWLVSRERCARLMPHLLQSLRVYGYEICPSCGFPLAKENNDNTCPECGSDRTPIMCFNCNYDLQGLIVENLRCPECGADQRHHLGASSTKASP